MINTDLNSCILSIESLLRLLKDINENSFSLKGISSIFEPIMEAAVESITLLANALSEGTPFWRRNPELIFSETSQDALGNPAQFKIVREIPIAWSEPLSDWLYDIASYLLEFKTKYLSTGFHDQFRKSKLPQRSSYIQEPLETPAPPKQPSHKMEDNQGKRGRARHYYWLRRQGSGRRIPPKSK